MSNLLTNLDTTLIGVWRLINITTAPKHITAVVLMIAFSLFLVSNRKAHREPFVIPTLRRWSAVCITLLWNCLKVTGCSLSFWSWPSCSKYYYEWILSIYCEKLKIARNRTVPEISRFHNLSHLDLAMQERWAPSLGGLWRPYTIATKEWRAIDK